MALSQALPSQGPGPAAGPAVYAIGDVHGRYDLLIALMALISDDQAASRFTHRSRLIFLGDYVDRGPDSARVLEALRWIRASPRFESGMLMGNHEQALLQFIRQTNDPRRWLGWGGQETLASYGVRPPAVDAEPGEIALAREALLRNMPAAHLDFLTSLDLMLSVGRYVFVHAGVRPGVALEEQTEEDLLWIREPFLESDKPFDKVVVHGHTWFDDQPRWFSNRIGVDTGAHETGVLTAVRLHGEEVAFLRATVDSSAHDR